MEHKSNMSTKNCLEMMNSISKDYKICDVLKYRILLMVVRHLCHIGGFTLDPYTYSKNIVNTLISTRK
jgi:hypothetical protein